MELTCTIANANEYPLLWVRLGDGEERNFPISHGQNLFIKTSQKFKLDSDDAAGTYTLKIKNIQPSDDATYQCQLVTTTEDMITADVKLQVPDEWKMKRETKKVVLGWACFGRKSCENLTREVACCTHSCNPLSLND